MCLEAAVSDKLTETFLELHKGTFVLQLLNRSLCRRQEVWGEKERDTKSLDSLKNLAACVCFYSFL